MEAWEGECPKVLKLLQGETEEHKLLEARGASYARINQRRFTLILRRFPNRAAIFFFSCNTSHETDL